ncbi:PQQ-binding-like beta-propeller repeat protein [Dactylosporangium roseum]|uniref:PQQ-binding-like beta-propeller repeat protein n=1 Tax=Dactylosporangium roseum TaxID=47989 RepID=A0ABY5Z8D0_9ACTN|nr:PQQ-binding-like beta-propeller repeat protein [Dactylosporangium roseum]UWZ38350.1 PQQ-binding-like beta-propeller repeat protein [Dactylosporangium roseum]
MPDAIIELDLSTPWEPPDPPPSPRRRAYRRWLAFAVVGLVAAGVLGAAAPGRDTGPVLSVDQPVLSIGLSARRIIVSRYEQAAPVVEALDVRDGGRLWSRPVSRGQHVGFVTEHVVALLTESGDENGTTQTLTALDAATGERLWERSRIQVAGRTPGRFLVEDMTGVTRDDRVMTITDDAQDAPVNAPAEQYEQRYRALDERTGAEIWSFDVPEGSVTSFDWESGYWAIKGISELSPAGVLRFRDVTTGAVTVTHRLDWSGTISGFAVGTALPGIAGTAGGQVLLYAAGERGADVHDLRTGRRLWHWEAKDSRTYHGLFPCAGDLYCVWDSNGTDALDAHTGQPVWHVDRYNIVLQRGNGTLLLGRWDEKGPFSSIAATVDGRTGRVLRRYEGWYLLQSQGIGPLVVWRQADGRGALLGVLDARSGRVTVFGRATDWFGSPACVAAGDDLVCSGVGGLTVWKLP